MQETDCGWLLKQLNDLLTKRMNRELQGESLTAAQMRVLLFLDRQAEKKAPLKAIERDMAVAQPTVVGLCRRLGDKGFISYLPDAKNPRAKWVQLTKEGQGKCVVAYGHMQDTEGLLLSHMEEEEKKLFYDLLGKALSALQK